MRVRIDGRLAPQAQRVAQAVAQALGPASRDVTGTAYLGAGAADLVCPDDPKPHVAVPLTTNAKVDPVARSQIASADVVVAMDREEAVRLRGFVRGAIVIIDAQPGSAVAAIHTTSPFDAAEVAAFLMAAPAMSSALRRLGLDLRAFESKVIVDAVIEAAMAAPLDSVG
jgi:hypothetical protein